MTASSTKNSTTPSGADSRWRGKTPYEIESNSTPIDTVQVAGYLRHKMPELSEMQSTQAVRHVLDALRVYKKTL